MLSGQHWTPITEEFSGAKLGDRRRTSRLLRIASALEKKPSASFPDAMGSVAELEAFYRLINNVALDLQSIVEPHSKKTLERAAQAKCVLAIHDTTQLVFSTYRDGFGATTHGPVKNGFLAHVTLLATEKDGRPLGISNVETWTRTGDKQKRIREKKLKPGTESEAERWKRGVMATEKLASRQCDIVHVADAESDIFDLMATMQERDMRLVIRSGRDRHVESDELETTLHDAVSKLKPRIQRTIRLNPRRHTKTQARLRSKRHPTRDAREAQVSIGVTEMTIPSRNSADGREVNLNCVRVWEQNAPESPVDWVLMTNEPVDTAEQLERVVNIYRKRWLIEEYFKALKTGCAIEKRQVESYNALVTVLGMFLPVAYRLLLVRHLDEEDPGEKATAVFSPIELTLMKNAPSNRGLPDPKTAHDALMHLARLGGHLRNNGRPGWQVLGRGYEKLLLMVEGWQIANDPDGTYDQS